MLFSLVKTNSGAFDELDTVYLGRWKRRPLNSGWSKQLDRDHKKTGSRSTSKQNLVQVVCGMKKKNKSTHYILWQMIRDFRMNWQNKLPWNPCCVCKLLRKKLYHRSVQANVCVNHLVTMVICHKRSIITSECDLFVACKDTVANLCLTLFWDQFAASSNNT